MEKKKYKKTSYSFKEESDIINFGIHEGKTIGEVMIIEPFYIDWCLSNFKGFKLGKKLTEHFNKLKIEKNG